MAQMGDKERNKIIRFALLLASFLCLLLFVFLTFFCMAELFQSEAEGMEGVEGK